MYNQKMIVKWEIGLFARTLNASCTISLTTRLQELRSRCMTQPRRIDLRRIAINSWCLVAFTLNQSIKLSKLSDHISGYVLTPEKMRAKVCQ